MTSKELLQMPLNGLADWLVGAGMRLEAIRSTDQREEAKKYLAVVREAADLSRGSGERLRLLEVALSLLRFAVDAKQEAIEKFYASGVPAKQVVELLAIGGSVNSSKFQLEYPDLRVLWEDMRRTDAIRVQCLSPGTVEFGGGWIVFAPDVTRFLTLTEGRP